MFIVVAVPGTLVVQPPLVQAAMLPTQSHRIKEAMVLNSRYHEPDCDLLADGVPEEDWRCTCGYPVVEPLDKCQDYETSTFKVHRKS